MERRLSRELLDDLPAQDARAARARKDLRRINAVMGNPGLLLGVLRSLSKLQRGQRRIVELGAGDGTLMLRVAKALGTGWQGTTVTFVDQSSLPTGQTEHAFRSVGWEVRFETADVFAWFQATAESAWDIMVCNLFLHHFSNQDVRRLFEFAAERCRVFIALEPWRGRAPLFFSHFVGLIGCNGVTRHDAVASVRAGFTGKELSRLWPDSQWQLEESCARHTTQLFIARKVA